MSNVIDFGSRSGKNRELRIATGHTVATNRVKNQTLKWPEVVERLRTPRVTTETQAEYAKLSKDEQGKIKDVGYFVPTHFEGGKRKGAHLGEKDLGTLDLDYAEQDSLERIIASYSSFAFVLHSTHKHTPANPRYRLVFLLNRGVTPEEYQAVMRAVAAMCDIDFCDNTTFEPARPMFYPSVSSDGEFEFHEGKGLPVDVDAVLEQSYLDWRNVAEWPVPKHAAHTARLSGKKMEDPRAKRGAIGAFCLAYTIPEAIDKFLPGVYVAGTAPNRYTFVGGSTSNGAVVYDDGLFLYSFHDTDPCSQRAVNAFDLVRLHLYGHLDVHQTEETAPSKLKSYQAMQVMAVDDDLVQPILIAERAQVFDDDALDFQGFDDDDGLTEVDDGLGDTPAADEPKKAKNLTLGQRIRDYKLHINAQLAVSRDRIMNITQILNLDPRVKHCVRRNTFTNELIQFRDIPGARRKKMPRLWSDLSEQQFADYCNKVYDVAFPMHLIASGVNIAADAASFDPVRDWLDALEWDGVSRLDRFLPQIVGAEANEYNATVFRKWLTAGVARQYEPGKKFDYILVIEGIEGLGKSRLFETLAHGWFCGDFTFGVSSKEIVEKTAGALIVEISELVQRANTEVEHVKAMLSRGEETVRVSYARNAGKYPRRFIFAGTTNESAYLRSETGNRRFWVVKADGRAIDIDAVAAIVPQLWAEARELYRAGERLWLDKPGIAAHAAAEQAARVEIDPWRTAIIEYLASPMRADHWGGELQDDEDPFVFRDRAHAAEIFEHALGGTLERANTQAVSRRITAIVRTIPGWECRPAVRFGELRTRGYLYETEDGLG